MPIFCAHWCISRSQLYRYMKKVVDGYPVGGVQDTSNSRARDSPKKDFVITWFLQYAAEVTEKLPDCDKMLLPRMLWTDLFSMFHADMIAAGYEEKHVCKIDYFRNTFNSVPELSDIQMTTFKRNFTKCKDCVRLTAAVTKALQAHDGRAIERAKTARLEHYVMARSDKLHYWHQRWQVCS